MNKHLLLMRKVAGLKQLKRIYTAAIKQHANTGSLPSNFSGSVGDVHSLLNSVREAEGTTKEYKGAMDRLSNRYLNNNNPDYERYFNGKDQYLELAKENNRPVMNSIKNPSTVQQRGGFSPLAYYKNMDRTRKHSKSTYKKNIGDSLFFGGLPLGKLDLLTEKKQYPINTIGVYDLGRTRPLNQVQVPSPHLAGHTIASVGRETTSQTGFDRNKALAIYNAIHREGKSPIKSMHKARDEHFFNGPGEALTHNDTSLSRNKNYETVVRAGYLKGKQIGKIIQPAYEKGDAPSKVIFKGDIPMPGDLREMAAEMYGGSKSRIARVRRVGDKKDEIKETATKIENLDLQSIDRLYDDPYINRFNVNKGGKDSPVLHSDINDRAADYDKSTLKDIIKKESYNAQQAWSSEVDKGSLLFSPNVYRNENAPLINKDFYSELEKNDGRIKELPSIKKPYDNSKHWGSVDYKGNELPDTVKPQQRYVGRGESEGTSRSENIKNTFSDKESVWTSNLIPLVPARYANAGGKMTDFTQKAYYSTHDPKRFGKAMNPWLEKPIQ